jgi:diaminopimelate epimerase
MKPIFFTKMEGSGNDFLLINNHNGLLNEFVHDAVRPELVKKMANRHLGAGSDGILFLESAKDFPFAMKYYNRDGSEATMCLNGTRCIVSYAFRLGVIKDKGKDGPVSIEVPPPVDIKMNFTFTMKRKKYRANFLKAGVPHCVIFVDSYDKIDVVEFGREIRNHKTFKPEGANVNFVVVENNNIFIRTYERGVENETLSCGSGVLASAYIATKLFLTQSPVTCKTKGGELLATIKDKLYLEGPANFIYDGVYYV